MSTQTFGALIGDIKLAHTLFALPFALMAAGLALLEGPMDGSKTATQIALVVLCMFGARTWAMAMNRFADAHFDSSNPRTAQRALPSGRATRGAMLAFAFFGAGLLILGAALLSRVALACALPLLVILASYSYAKRFTWLCHFWLGLCLGLAPIAAWLAIRGTIRWPLVVLAAAITFWVGGFDIIYALQDETFDRKAGLRSIPASFGAPKALSIARMSHALALVLFAVALAALGLWWAAIGGTALAAALLTQQHVVLSKRGHAAIPFAFFNLNAWISVGLLVAVILDVTLRKGFLP